MKRSLLIIPFAVLAFVLFSSTGFSRIGINIAYNMTTGKITYGLYPGWNLVPMGISVYASTEGNACGDYVKASYVYSPVQNQYLGAYYPRKYTIIQVPENSDQILQNEKNSNFYHAILGGMWIYTTKYCELETNLQPRSAYTSMQENIGTMTIKKGWNFITAYPFMIDDNLKDLFQSCDVLAANIWNSYSQEWMYASSSQNAGIVSDNDANIYDSAVGTIFVVKVAEDCHLTVGGGGISPPPLPD